MASAPAPLLLVPTAPEQAGVARALGAEGPAFELACHLSGFGLIAAAARTAQLIAQHKPSHTVLMGIAGTYDPDLRPVGSVTVFGQVASYGIGVGEGAAYLTPEAIGYPQWDGDGALPALPPTLGLAALPGAGAHPTELLLSVVAASATPGEAEIKRSLFPTAMAEDMESFGVAMACAMAGVPCSIVRGISNVVGDRDVGRWQVLPALEAVAGALTKAGLA